MEETAYDFIVPEELADRRVDVVSAELCSELTRSVPRSCWRMGSSRSMKNRSRRNRGFQPETDFK